MTPDHPSDEKFDEADEEVTFRRDRQAWMRSGRCEEVDRAKATADEVRAEMRDTAVDVNHMEKLVRDNEGGTPKRTCGKQEVSRKDDDNHQRGGERGTAWKERERVWEQFSMKREVELRERKKEQQAQLEELERVEIAQADRARLILERQATADRVLNEEI